MKPISITLAIPRATRLLRNSKEQMVKHLREHKGDGEYPSVHRPDGLNARHDATVVTALD